MALPSGEKNGPASTCPFEVRRWASPPLPADGPDIVGVKECNLVPRTARGSGAGAAQTRTTVRWRSSTERTGTQDKNEPSSDASIHMRRTARPAELVIRCGSSKNTRLGSRQRGALKDAFGGLRLDGSVGAGATEATCPFRRVTQPS